MKHSEERSFIVNALLFLLCIFILFFGELLFSIVLKSIITNKYVLNIVSSLFMIASLYLIYYKDLNREFKTYISKFKENFFLSLKYYFVGLLSMIFFNILISFIIKDVSANENIVRNMLFETPIYTLFSIIVVAPLSEEIIFRKSIRPLVNNKIVYALICALLFGGAHLIAGEFKLINLLYLLPYGSLGFVFALMDYDIKSTWASIVVHALHNGITGVVLLITYYLGGL